jgi:hypothetical protein
MEAKKLTLVTLTLALLVVIGHSQTLPPAQGGQAIDRASKYYAALEAGNFTEAWSFFGARMRADTPRETYVADSGRILVKVRVVKPPTLATVDTTGTQKRPIARIRTRVAFLPKEGKEFEDTHVTEWVWQRSPDSAKDDWFLARDSFGEGGTATSSLLIQR